MRLRVLSLCFSSCSVYCNSSDPKRCLVSIKISLGIVHTLIGAVSSEAMASKYSSMTKSFNSAKLSFLRPKLLSELCLRSIAPNMHHDSPPPFSYIDCSASTLHVLSAVLDTVVLSPTSLCLRNTFTLCFPLSLLHLCLISCNISSESAR